VRLALSLSTTRPPSEDESRRGVDLIAALRAKEGIGDEVALKYYCLIVLNLNEFAYLD
jgi:hypothetical protein